MMASRLLPPLGVYVHWPFCTAICPYCDFNVHGAHLNKTAPADWLAAYQAELRHAYRLRPVGEVETVFFGGGTPSLMPPQLVGGILETIDALWGLAARAEISLEANPVSAPRDGLQALADEGITRLSLGVQAFDDDALKQLGRTHTADDARHAFEAAQDIFQTASFDLIYARADHVSKAALVAWEKELSAALALQPRHMSLYQLTLEPETAFFKRAAQGKLSVPAEDGAAALYELTQDICTAAGLPAYEISNHAAAAHQCAHNRAIWQGGDYVGIGPGAHGRLSFDGHKHASIARKNPQDWLRACMQNGHGWHQNEALSADGAAEELVMLALRLVDGRALKILAQQGVQFDDARLQSMESLRSDGLLVADEAMLQATPKGRLLLDYIIGRLLA